MYYEIIFVGGKAEIKGTFEQLNLDDKGILYIDRNAFMNKLRLRLDQKRRLEKLKNDVKIIVIADRICKALQDNKVRDHHHNISLEISRIQKKKKNVLMIIGSP